MPALVLLLVQVTLVLATARAVGLVARRMGQPIVVAEMVAGILLGPSVLGRAAPHVWVALFPSTSTPVLGVVSQVGLILFMFLVGLELDVRQLKGRAPAAAAISVASAAVPVALAVPLALYLHPRQAPAVALAPFVLFIGAAMSITAFPVLARILVERRLLRTRVGTLAIASAAVVDVIAACVVAFLVAMVRRGHFASAVWTTTISVGFAAAMLFVVRPLLMRTRWLPRASSDGMSQNAVAIAIVLLLGASLATELAGVGGLFGAFMLGAVLPKDGGFARQLAEKIEDLVLVFFLPLFFAYSGLRTELGVLGSGEAWSTCALIVAVAFLGKLGAGAAAARLAGLPWAEAGAVGALLNTRGVVEVVVLNVGLDLHLVPPGLFSMLIVMALVTTLATAPLLDVFYPRERALSDAMAPEPQQAEFTALVCVEDFTTAAPLVEVARALAGDHRARVHLLRPLPQDDRASRVLAAQEQDDEMQLPRFEGDMEVRAMSFVSQRPARDVCDLADAKDASVIVLPSLGTPKAALGRAMVREVMASAGCPVAILVAGAPRSELSLRRVLVLGRKRTPLAEGLARGLSVEIATIGEAEARAASPSDVLVVDAADELAGSDDIACSRATVLLVHAPTRGASALSIAAERARSSGGSV